MLNLKFRYIWAVVLYGFIMLLYGFIMVSYGFIMFSIWFYYGFNGEILTCLCLLPDPIDPIPCLEISWKGLRCQ